MHLAQISRCAVGTLAVLVSCHFVCLWALVIGHNYSEQHCVIQVIVIMLAGCEIALLVTRLISSYNKHSYF